MRGYFCPLVVHLVHKQSESSGRPHHPLVGRSPFPPSSPSSSFSIRFIDLAFAFLVYLGAGLFAQLLCEAARLFGGVAFEPLHHPYSPQVRGWVTLFAITCNGLALSCYFWFLGREKVEYVFWRLTKPSKQLFQRGLKDFSFGVLAWLITFPCVTLIALAVSLSLHYFIHVPGIEQVAVQYLRSVQGYPLLFKMMVVALGRARTCNGRGSLSGAAPKLVAEAFKEALGYFVDGIGICSLSFFPESGVEQYRAFNSAVFFRSCSWLSL